MIYNDDIRQYTLEKYGFIAKNGWIAHAKEVYGLPTRKAPNRIGKERKYPCSKSNLERIKEAFIHFKMLE